MPYIRRSEKQTFHVPATVILVRKLPCNSYFLIFFHVMPHRRLYLCKTANCREVAHSLVQSPRAQRSDFGTQAALAQAVT